MAQWICLFTSHQLDTTELYLKSVTKGILSELQGWESILQGEPVNIKGIATNNSIARKENEEEKSMTFDPALSAMMAEPWSNGACRGYVIMAMENCGFSSDDIRRMMAELHELFDFVSLEEAEAHYQKSLF